MRRAHVLLLLALALLLTACDPPGRKKKVVSPLPETVMGTLPEDQSASLTGDPTKGKALFVSTGCGGCHVYKPAGTSGKVGPDLDDLAAHAEEADQGPLPAYVSTSIKNPDAYLVPGFQEGVMPSYGGQLSDQEIADLVAFLTKP
ncbi:MAG: cytochrome c [Actinomycetota bacterium]|nr:cytochrome c [Actinomycetota bacterium]